MFNLKDILEAASKLTSSRGIAVLILIIALLLSAIYGMGKLEFGPFASGLTSTAEQAAKSLLSKPTESKRVKEDVSGDALISVTHVQMPPRGFPNLDAYLYFEITNTGTNAAPTLDVRVDFGSSTVKGISTAPSSACRIPKLGTQESVVELQCGGLPAKTSLYVYAEISDPRFNSIVVNSAGLSVPVVYSDEDYARRADGLSSFGVFLEIVAGGVVIVITIYALVVAINLVNRKLRL